MDSIETISNLYKQKTTDKIQIWNNLNKMKNAKKDLLSGKIRALTMVVAYMEFKGGIR